MAPVGVDILIVEDEPGHAESIRRSLNAAGIDRARIAGSLREYREEIARAVPDVVLMDLKLPDGEALSVLADEAAPPPFPLIMMTSHGDEQKAVQALKAGALDYVVKSAAMFAETPRIVDRALREWKLIQDRRQAEAALRASEARYRRISETITDYVYTVHVRDGRPERTSHGSGCVAVTGYLPAEFEQDDGLWIRMVPDEDRAMVVEKSMQCLSGRNVPPFEHRIVRKDGQVRWIRNTIAPRVGPDDRLVSYDGLVQDITEQRTLQDALFQAQKREALGHLAAGVAHNFNNLLFAAYCCVEIIEKRLAVDVSEAVRDDCGRSLSQLRQVFDSGTRLVRQLVAFCRGQPSKQEVVDVNEVVRGMVQMLGDVLGRSVRLCVVADPADCHVLGDRSQVEQVILNLAINARDAMPKGGTLTIETARLLPPTTLLAQEPGHAGRPHVRLSVTDTGTGMAESTRIHLFEPFFTTKPLGQGAGLGLATVQGIVKRFDGLVDVESALGQGASFHIYLPCVSDGMIFTE